MLENSPARDGPPAVSWKLHREVLLLAGWGRAILLQLAHPLVAEGVARHSEFLAGRMGWFHRLERTLRAMLSLTFGTPEEVARVARSINGIHDRVNGYLRESGGGLPAGTRYSAHDPALLAWVHATLLDSFLLAYELFVAPLTGAERDRYCEESSSMGPLLGIPPGWLPRTAPELRVYLADALSSGQIEVTATARALSREIVNPPAPLIVRPLLALARWPAIGLLPPGIRAAYGFSWSPGQERALAALGASCRRLIPFVPPAVRHWPAARAAEARERRAAGAVSSTFGIRRSDRGGCSGR